MNRRFRHAPVVIAALAVASVGLGCTPAPETTANPIDRASRLEEPKELGIGLIQLMPFRLEDGSWLPSEGQTIDLFKYVSLFESIGLAFGGEGRTTFMVPNLKQAAPDPSLTYHILTRIGTRSAPPETNQPLGMISLFAMDFVPAQFAACDGQQLPKAGNEALAKALNATGETITLPRLTAPLPGLQYAMLVKDAAMLEVGGEALMGTVALTSAFRAPKNWLRCDGKVLQVNTNHALSTLLGTRFGDGGAGTFKLPDLRGKEPAANLTYYIAQQGIYPSRR